MGDIVNLTRERKRTVRKADEAKADANRMRFGRPVSERRLNEARAELDQRRLDAHKRPE
jgi:chorismate mutase